MHHLFHGVGKGVLGPLSRGLRVGHGSSHGRRREVVGESARVRVQQGDISVGGGHAGAPIGRRTMCGAGERWAG